MNYFLLSTITRILLGKLRKYHKEDPQLLVFSRDFIGEEIFAYGVYEKNDIKTILKALDFDSKQHTILDIGANIGNHAVQFAKHFNKVHCFEPNHLAFQVLQLNTRNLSNVIIHPYGLSNRYGKLGFSIPEGNLGGGGVTLKNNNKTLTIEVKKGDEVVSEAFAVIKIDIEGHEFEAISGLEKKIILNKPIICFELINETEKDLIIIEKLKSLGYNNFYIPKQVKLFGRAVNSFSLQFFAQLFSKQQDTLVPIKNFNGKMYNLIICEHPSSSFKIKQKQIKS